MTSHLGDLNVKYPEVMTSELGRQIIALAFRDANQLLSAERSYGDSWQARGGVGAFMNLARKWDRLSRSCEQSAWDIFLALERDVRSEGLADDLRDLRHYTILIDLRCIRAPQYVKETPIAKERCWVPAMDPGLRPQAEARLRDDDPPHRGPGDNCEAPGCTSNNVTLETGYEFCLVHDHREPGDHS